MAYSQEGATRAPRWLVALVIVLVTIPLAFAIGGQLIAVGDDYHALGDLADIELHTRDIGTRNVEVGQYSREEWAHPGPAQFYAFALPYRLTGSRSVGLNVAALLINGGAIAGILLICHRRGGAPLLWLGAVALAIVVRGWGPGFLLDPWNPSVPVLPFGLFLFLVWDLSCGRAWALPAAAVVATFCAQTHIGYLPIVVPLAALGTAIAVVRTVRAGESAPNPRQLAVAGAATAGLLAVMWLPPMLEELRQLGDGNLSRAIDFFRHGEGEPHTLREGYDSMAEQLEVLPDWMTGTAEITAFTGELDVSGPSPLPLLLLPFVAGVAWWWRRRSTRPLLLASLAGAAAVVSVLAVARTLGPLYQYRLGWTRLVAMSMLLVPAWALWTWLAQRSRVWERRLLVPTCAVVIGVLAVMGAPRFARADPPMSEWNERFDRLAPRVMEELPPGDGAVILRCDGDEGCIYLGGLVLLMERQGIDVRVENEHGLVITGAPHRGYDGGPVRAVLHVGVGAGFYANAARPDVEVIARDGPAPTPRRAEIAEALLDLEAAYAAGEVDSEAHFVEQQGLLKQLGDGIGVVVEPLER